jgi:hypothetical protein
MAAIKININLEEHKILDRLFLVKYKLLLEA